MKHFILPTIVVLLALGGCGEDDPCPSGSQLCDNQCVDYLTDDNHCGQCHNACGIHADCINGSCTCIEDYADCDGDQSTGCEVDISLDRNNCGACNNVCSADEECCYKLCYDLNTSMIHCGKCGNSCSRNESCVAGFCK